MRFSWEKCNDKILPIGVGVLAFIVLLLVVFQVFKSPEVVYVDNTKLFEGFNMTKEMKKIGELEFKNKQNQLDSIYAKINTPEYANNREFQNYFFKKREELEEATRVYASQETQKIWQRLRGYLKDYAQTKNYEMIIGSSSNEQVLYSSENLDITEEVLIFVNNSYEGK